MFDAGSPYDVVARAFEYEGPDGHLLAPLAAYEHGERRTLLAGSLSACAPLSCRVDTPLDLNGVGPTNAVVVAVDEVAEEPTAVLVPVVADVVPVLVVFHVSLAVDPASSTFCGSHRPLRTPQPVTATVFRGRNGVDASTHAVRVEDPVQMVGFVADESCDIAVEAGYPMATVDVLVLDFD
jgi:hypothetical protein